MTEQMSRSDPYSYPPRGMSRYEAARWVGVSPSLFDQMVDDGRMPGPKRINSRLIWDRYRLDVAVEALPEKEEVADDWKAAV